MAGEQGSSGFAVQVWNWLRQHWDDVFAVLVIVVFAAWFSLVPAAQGEVMGDPTYAENFSPWRAAETHQTDYAGYWSDLTLDDATLSVYPAHKEVREQIRDGHLPLWDTRLLTGVPLWAEGMGQPLNPTTWIAYALPLWSGWMVKLFADILLCALAWFLFIRSRGHKPVAALTGAMAFTFNPAFVACLPLGSVIGGFAWVPLVMYLLERVAQGDAKGRVGWTGACGLAIGAQLLTTNLQFALYGGLIEAVWLLRLLIPLIREHAEALKLVLRAGIAALLGFAINAVQLVPMLEMIGQSGRDPSKYAGINWIHPSLLPTLLAPSFYGTPASGTFTGGGLFFLPPSSVLLLTMGMLTVVLAVIGAWHRRTTWTRLLVVSALVPPGLLLMASWPPFLALLEMLPVFNSLQATRGFVVSYFAVALLAAHGVSHLLQSTSPLRATGRVVGALLLAMAIGGGLTLMVWPGSPMAGQLNLFVDDPDAMWLALGVPAALAVGLLVVTALRTRAKLWGWGLPLLVAVELIILASARLETAQPTELYPATDAIDALVDAQRKAPGRLVGTTDPRSFPKYSGDNLPANMASMYGISDIRGYVPLPPHVFAHMAAKVEQPNNPTHYMAGINFSRVSSQWFDLVGARYLLTTQRRIISGWDPVWVDGEHTVLSNTRVLPELRLVTCASVLPDIDAVLAAIESGRARDSLLMLAGAETRLLPAAGCLPSDQLPTLTRPPSPDGAFDIDIQVPPTGAYLVVSDTWFPGWRASVNEVDVPILRAYGAFRAIVLPPGTTRVRMWYEPASYTLGLSMSLIALLVAAGMFMRRSGPAKTSVVHRWVAALRGNRERPP